MTYAETLLGLLPPVSYARNAPKIRAQAHIHNPVAVLAEARAYLLHNQTAEG